ncbi:Galactoside 3(4)-L-fucosyltransferase [Dermatophagoides farinae]|nr:Galactoside 3(4)-L-fucosyltransferase [Dermatophagoides farinae]
MAMAITILNGNLMPRIRLIIFICLGLWALLFLLNSFSLVNRNLINYYSIQYMPFINDTTIVVDKNGNVTTEITYHQLTQYVQLSSDKVQNFRIILFWTKYFDQDLMYQMKKSLNGDTENLLFRPKPCYYRYPNCLVTTNRDFIATAKVIIFHWRDFHYNDLPAQRNSNQLWTIYNLEAPPNTALLPDRDDLIFNLTATYRHDSDIYVPYGQLIARNHDFDLESNIDIRYKIKPVVWFVSNCHTQSHRENYVQKLSRMVQVDIYGKCGKFQCPHSHECYQKAAREYLFYLSFENSLCKDYVTEKLFNVLNYDIVPIVFGGANYSSILPAGSYIDATRMKPETLARLIMKIASNRKLYLSYFEWRKKYSLDSESDMNSNLYCQLCKRLEQNVINDKNTFQTSKEINHWYFDDACRNPDI